MLLAAPLLGLALSTRPDDPAPRVLSPEAMRADLGLLLETLETWHAGLLRYTPRAELDGAAERAARAMTEPLSVQGYHRALAELVAAVRCGHTRLLLPDSDRAAILARDGAPALEVHLEGERAWVVRALAENVALAPGAEVESVDGLSIAEIRRRAFLGLVSDGFNETRKERELERRFGEHFVLLADELDRERSEHEVRLVGAAEPVRVPALPLDAYRAALDEGGGGPLVRLGFPFADVALLEVGAFGDPPGGLVSFPELLARAFAEIRQARAAAVILDLRGNGGGVDLYGALLVSHFRAEPFRYFERIEVTAGYEGPGDVVEEGGRRLVTAHGGLSVREPTEPAFLGPLYVLIDGRTFSTAADVATVLHHLGRATFLGEETGGGYDGNTSGNSMVLALPATGLSVSVPFWTYTTASLDADGAHPFPGHGVPADVPVDATIEDVLEGRDAVLERAIELATGG